MAQALIFIAVVAGVAIAVCVMVPAAGPVLGIVVSAMFGGLDVVRTSQRPSDNA